MCLVESVRSLVEVFVRQVLIPESDLVEKDEVVETFKVFIKAKKIDIINEWNA